MAVDKYDTACDFLAKADWEGGLAELVVGYGVTEGQVPDEVWQKILLLKVAHDELEVAVNDWHLGPGGCEPTDFIQWDDDGDHREECPWR